MRFVFHSEAGALELWLEGESFAHIFSVRRHKQEQNLALRNLRDHLLYTYRIQKLTRKGALLALESSLESPLTPPRFSHIIWAITQAKTLQKSLPALNELGLGKLSLFWSDYSQKTHQIDEQKLRKILIGSCEQCGRSSLLELELFPSMEAVLRAYPYAFVLDFTGEVLDRGGDYGLASGAIVGAEGGFSQRERELFSGRRIARFDTGQILRSETAVLTLLAKDL